MSQQSATMLGGYRAQGRTAVAGRRLIEDARVLEEAGACAILLECIPAEVAGIIHERAGVPVYGLGCGLDVDGQLMIVHDMIGLFERFVPKFVKQYANLSPILLEAFSAYHGDVKGKAFPGPEHLYSMVEGETEKLRELVLD